MALPLLLASAAPLHAAIQGRLALALPLLPAPPTPVPTAVQCRLAMALPLPQFLRLWRLQHYVAVEMAALEVVKLSEMIEVEASRTSPKASRCRVTSRRPLAG